MNKRDIKRLVDRAIREYKYENPDRPTLGRPWPKEKVAADLEFLKASLIEPYLAPVRLGVGPELQAALPERQRHYWIVASSSDGFTVFFDPEKSEFGLAMGRAPDGLETINVRGDLVGTFMAR